MTLSITLSWKLLCLLIYFWAYIAILCAAWGHAVKDGRKGIILIMVACLAWPAFVFFLPPGRKGEP